MGWFSDAFSWVTDDVLGFDPPQVNAPPPAAQPGVSTTDPATNTPTPTPVQTSFDQVKSYLNAQAQRAYIIQLKKLTKDSGPDIRPPTITQTEEGQKFIKYGIFAVIAWLFFIQR